MIIFAIIYYKMLPESAIRIKRSNLKNDSFKETHLGFALVLQKQQRQ